MSKESHSFSPSVAVNVGVNAALVLQHLLFLQKALVRKGQEWQDVWVKRSVKSLTETYPYLSPKEIRGTFDRLERDGLCQSKIENIEPGDRTKSFNLTELGLELMGETHLPFRQMGEHIDENHLPKGQMHLSKRANAIKVVVNSCNKRDVVSNETTALSSKMDSGQQLVESSKIHGMAAPSEISVELPSPPETETIETPCGTTLEIEAHPPASVETVSKTAYSPDFEAFWKAYRFPVGSKAMASQKWKRLSDSERASALAAIPVHIQSTTTDRNRPRNAEFLPMRCHAVVYLSQKRWEAYADSVSIAVGSSAPTKWDEKYKGYLQTCKQRWPGALETVSFLSKAEYCAFQEGRYLKGISMVGTDMQKSRLMRCHDRWEAGESAARTHSSIWACFLAEMSFFIEKSKAV